MIAQGDPARSGKAVAIGQTHRTELIALSLAALPRFFANGRASGSFKLSGKCDQPLVSIDRLARYSSSYRYALITALGLGAYHRTYPSVREAFAFGPIWEQLEHSIAHFTEGELGLFLWAQSERNPHNVDPAADRLAAKIATDASRLSTLDLSFAAIGMTAIGRTDQALPLIDLLTARVGSGGLARGGPSTAVLAPLCNSVYVGIALAHYAMATGRTSQLTTAVRMVQALARLQGPQGEWYWIYNTDHGTVADRYPLYSVHQTGMMPLLLRAVRQACGSEIPDVDTDEVCDRSIAWVFGHNELHTGLIDPQLRVMWRGIRRSQGVGRQQFYRVVAGLGGGAWLDRIVEGREVNRETRSYTYGWTLRALCDDPSGGAVP